MISLEGLTLATGRHDRGRLHPAHLRPLRPRRADPQPVPRGRAARASTTPPTPRCGSSTPSTATWRPRGDRATLRLLLPMLRRHRRAPPRGTRFGIHVDPDDGLLAPGRGGLPAHLDGRQGGRLGGDAAARQGGRDQRPLVQRPAPAGGLAAQEQATRQASAGRSPAHRRRAERAASRSTAASGTPPAATCTTWWTASSGDDPACRPNQIFAISLDAPGPRPRRAGSRCSTWCGERLLTPVGLRSLAPGDPDYKPQLRRRPARARRRLPPGDGLGLADRPLRRRLAAGPSRTTAAGAHASCTASCRTWARRASARSARSSTPSRRSRRAAASPRRGASPRCCGPGSPPRPRPRRRRSRSRAPRRWRWRTKGDMYCHK